MTPTPLAHDPASLQARLRAVNPTVRIVKERHLRRAIILLLDAGYRLPFRVDRPLAMSRERANSLEVFPDAVFAESDAQFLLITDPDDRLMHEIPDPVLLRHYWQLLYREAIKTAVDSQAAIRLWQELPRLIRNEAKFVLESEHVVVADAGPAELYAAFIAEAEALRQFHPSALKYFFPSLHQVPGVDLTAGLDFPSLLHRTRPEGAANLADTPPAGYPTEQLPVRSIDPKVAEAEAEKHLRKGNHVRAAVAYYRAATQVQEGRQRLQKLAQEQIQQLTTRIGKVLGWSLTLQDEIRVVLMSLLEPARGGTWPSAVKVLYTLQKIPVDLEQDIYRVDPAAWVRSLFRKPVIKKLDLARVAIQLKHLKHAIKYLMPVPLDEEYRTKLTRILRAELDRTESILRERIKPILTEVIKDVGFVPESIPEQVAREKLIGELLDQICERGYIRLGDLRDAVARNRLKQPDLSGPREFLLGDTLLRADALLGERLEGLHRRGEFYLRWIQRGSSLAFGTRIGRAITRFAALPFLAAVMTVEFSKYLVKEGSALYGFISGLVTYQDEALTQEANPVADAVQAAGEAVQAPAAGHAHAAHASGGIVSSASLTAIGILTVFFLFLLHSAVFRRLVVQALTQIGHLLQGLFWTLPRMLWQLPALRIIRNNRATRFLNRRFGVAILVAGVCGLGLLLFGASYTRSANFAGWTFLILALVTNTRLGRQVQDETEEFFSDLRRSIITSLLLGVWPWFVWVFREFLGAVDRMLHSMDEWFRFREGQSKPSLVLKVILGFIWFPIAYAVRFIFFLLIEPQVNPVKHFPVVTVSHKLLLTQIVPLARPVSTALAIPVDAAIGLITFVFACIPGIFGFIVWELKENWRLYRANRSRTLDPVPLGHHGESMRGLLRPGFHSGTVPSLYRKMRRVLQKSDRQQTPAYLGKPLEGLHHVEHALHLFWHREFLDLLHHDPLGQQRQLHVTSIEICVQTIITTIEDRSVPQAEPFRMAFHHQDGEISAEVLAPGFTEHLNPHERETWDTALTGLLAMAAVPTTSTITTWSNWVEYWSRIQKGTVRSPGHSPDSP